MRPDDAACRAGLNINPPADIDQIGHRTGRTSARGGRVEVITCGERRRTWTAEQKCEMAAEGFGPEPTPKQVARRYAHGSGQRYTWRRKFPNVQPGTAMTRRRRGSPRLS
jgi:transposase-like protein